MYRGGMFRGRLPVQRAGSAACKLDFHSLRHRRQRTCLDAEHDGEDVRELAGRNGGKRA